MKLNNRGWGLNKMIICSAILLVALLFSLYLCFQLPKEEKKIYKSTPQKITTFTIEDKIREEALKYVQKYYQKSLGKTSLIIPTSNLIYYHFLNKENLQLSKHDSCDGYALVTQKKKDNLNVEAYIKCNHYETRGFVNWE